MASNSVISLHLNTKLFEILFAYLSSLFFKLLDGSFINSSTFIDEMPSSGGFPRINMADDHNVDVDLLFPHDGKGQEERMGWSFLLSTAIADKEHLHTDTRTFILRSQKQSEHSTTKLFKVISEHKMGDKCFK